MASASLLLSEQQFLCSICLDMFTDPITTPCGHNYCKACITHYWDTKDVCQCPLCNKNFSNRPDIFVNTFMSEMVDQFRKSQQRKETPSTNQEPAKPDEVPCDVCDKAKLRALKTCLVCLASYCETHLEPHQRAKALKRHKLIDPVKNLEDVMCKKHDRPLELFCKTDHMCVCQFCTESDHRLHQIVSMKEQCKGKKAELGKTEAQVQQMIQERQVKIQEVKRSVKLSKTDADKEIAHGVKIFTDLVGIIEEGQAKLIGEIEQKKKSTEKRAEGFIKELQQEISALKKRSSELKQLSHTEDYLQLLQNFTSINTPPPTKNWREVIVHPTSYVGTVMRAVTSLEKMLYAIQFTHINRMCDAELRRIQQYAVDVTLDPDTANCWLILSEDGKQVNDGDIENDDDDDNTKRFSEDPSVLGKQSFSSGRFYYEVQVKGKTDWYLGVASESINRKVEVRLSPDDGYWTICLENRLGYGANYCRDNSLLILVRRKLVRKVGVFVDYEEGLVSFYDVSHRAHLYSFTGCTFTENLYPYFCPGDNDGGKNSAPLIISPVNHTD